MSPVGIWFVKPDENFITYLHSLFIQIVVLDRCTLDWERVEEDLGVFSYIEADSSWILKETEMVGENHRPSASRETKLSYTRIGPEWDSDLDDKGLCEP